ncbi:uncharacterized protein fam217ba [Corythoichthys intestinalis]|uniref:uncharacterized protein fam217ba n=1 Tax=Corythoichthys intestinalis TaxID=161448 RepID=UPI0025A5FD52|nr:uncharacterized protein fam217ba [Corythoichthys intestinalis]XP_057686424.1 uncharacterized protein fam217ba [Corythoichthys intestinalis]
MGPIIQERAASTTLKRVVSKEKIRVKNTENSGPNSSSRKGKQMKKTVGQAKSGQPGSGQDQNTLGTMHRGSQLRSSKLKSGTSRNTSKLPSPAEERDIRPQLGQHSRAQRNEERRNNQRTSQCSIELQQNHGGMSKNRRALSLPLSPISGLRHTPGHPLIHSPAPIAEALQDPYKVDDSDSASDLSDSERLPVLPSPCTPCTPPHLNLRAEVINSSDFPLDIPGPHGNENNEDESKIPSHCYPDFLPPPFNTWSLRQLAVFLHTEGRGAPRPKPVGPLERFLERLLQLEWLQIQTVQTESSRQPGRHTRPQATSGQSPRPHTAPSSRLNSPKGARHSQRAFPCVINPPSPASAVVHSRLPLCPHCHIRYPLCNGSCSAYAYQRHSRLSPLLERKTRPGAPVKRSCSETQEATKEGRSQGAQGGGGAQIPVSPSAEKSHFRHMHAPGNTRKHPQELGTSPNGQGQVRKTRIRTNSETNYKNEPGVVKSAGAEKHVLGGSKKTAIASKKLEDWQRTAAGQVSKTAMKRVVKDPQSLSKTPSSGGKTKNVQSVAK